MHICVYVNVNILHEQSHIVFRKERDCSGRREQKNMKTAQDLNRKLQILRRYEFHPFQEHIQTKKIEVYVGVAVGISQKDSKSLMNPCIFLIFGALLVFFTSSVLFSIFFDYNFHYSRLQFRINQANKCKT